MSAPRPLTDEERRVAIRYLKAARRLIRSRKETYICYTLIRAAGRYSQPDRRGTTQYRVLYHLLDWIQKMLRGYGTLGQWRLAHGFFGVLERSYEANQLARLAWLKWMINELKEGR